MEELTLNAKQGSKKDMEMRKVLLEQVEAAHAAGKPRILGETDPGFALNVAEMKMSRDQVRELRGILHGALMGFFSASETPKAEAVAGYAVCVCIYPTDPA